MRLAPRPRPQLQTLHLEMAKAHRDVSLKVGYTMPRFARQARQYMRAYALKARGKA